ncbi:hypothetical protein ACFYO5_11285 [Streptomyces sp. NPDC006259]|uniref:hypothetical protein n=1 Tax=Streptomyces sp. NPDC006259 TaxID=3364740 RepID=UPI0036CF24A9
MITVYSNRRLVMSMRQRFRFQATAAGTVVLLAAGAVNASATTIIGFGNAASNNACTNTGAPTLRGATTAGPGVVNALNAAVPVGSPTNNCGGLGWKNGAVVGGILGYVYSKHPAPS